MRISSLQFGLIIAGVLLVAGVLAYNYWVLRRARGPAAGVRGDADTEAPIVRVEPRRVNRMVLAYARRIARIVARDRVQPQRDIFH